MSVQEKMEAELLSIFDSIRDSRQKYYTQNPDKVPTLSNIDYIISNCANKNMAITGGLSLAVGPWGLLTIVPEIALVMRNQIAMIYDIGYALGKEKYMTKELLLALTLSAMGTSATGLAVLHGSKYVVKRASLRLFQKAVKILAGKVTQQLVKSTLARWVPLLGAAALATWSNYSTRQIGKKAKENLSKEILIDDSETQDIDFQDVSESIQDNKEVLRIKCLINLMKIDRNIHPDELSHLHTLISNSNIGENEKNGLREALNSTELLKFSYEELKSDREDMIALLMDLIVLAQKDNKLHPAEKAFIYQAAKELEIEQTLVEELIEAETLV